MLFVKLVVSGLCNVNNSPMTWIAGWAILRSPSCSSILSISGWGGATTMGVQRVVCCGNGHGYLSVSVRLLFGGRTATAGSGFPSFDPEVLGMADREVTFELGTGKDFPTLNGVVSTASRRFLGSAGFLKLDSDEDWALPAGGNIVALCLLILSISVSDPFAWPPFGTLLIKSLKNK